MTIVRPTPPGDLNRRGQHPRHHSVAGTTVVRNFHPMYQLERWRSSWLNVDRAWCPSRQFLAVLTVQLFGLIIIDDWKRFQSVEIKRLDPSRLTQARACTEACEYRICCWKRSQSDG